MASIKIRGIEEISRKLMALEEASEPIGKMAVYEGAKVVADEARRQIEALPVDKSRWLKDGDQYSVITEGDKKDLADHLGIQEIEADETGIRTVIGFAGYGSRKTKKYPNGLPMPMLARSVNSGSSVRKKHPFMRVTLTNTKQAAKAAMTKKASALIDSTLGQ